MHFTRVIKWARFRFELLFWTSAQIILFFLPVNGAGLSFCPSKLLGFGQCPGCGIGHAIHYALRLQWTISIHHHPLGIAAVMIIFMRIKTLASFQTKKYETQPDQHDTFH